jgi:hypothetical protein
MAATTISRATWTDDSGTPAVPVGDGTVINNARLQADIYDKIDALFTASFTFGNLVNSEGFGTHLFSAGGTGANLIRVRNTSAGTGNYAGLSVLNNSSVGVELRVLSSTHGGSGFGSGNSGELISDGDGGLAIASSHASGAIRFYVNSTNERMRITNTGQVFIGDTSDAGLTTKGLCINNSSGGGSYILTLKDSSLVAHGGLSSAETDTFGSFGVQSSLGGLSIAGYMEAGASPALELIGHGASGSGDTTKSTTAQGYVAIRAVENNGAITADENILVLRTSGTTRHIFDSDGDYHYDGAAPANYDRWDDIGLLRALDLVCAGPDLIESAWDQFVTYNRTDLERAGILSTGGFVNLTKHTRLLNGGMWQLFTKVKALEQRLQLLEG